MPLYCPTNLSNTNFGFTEFIECSTISINYDLTGVATISFTVVSVSSTPLNTYTTLTFGGVTFTGFITSLEVRKVSGTVVYEHRYTISAYGC